MKSTHCIPRVRIPAVIIIRLKPNIYEWKSFVSSKCSFEDSKLFIQCQHIEMKWKSTDSFEYLIFYSCENRIGYDHGIIFLKSLFCQIILLKLHGVYYIAFVIWICKNGYSKEWFILKIDFTNISCPHCGREYNFRSYILSERYYCVKCLKPFSIKSDGTIQKIEKLKSTRTKPKGKK